MRTRLSTVWKRKEIPVLPVEVAPELAPMLAGDPFAKAFALEGEVFRCVKNRKTIRFLWNGRPYFVKLHRGVGWREILKNIFQLKRPVLGAANEYRAIRHLEKLGIDTMRVCAFGERGWNPASRESFLITAELEHMISLEDYCREWNNHPPEEGLKRRLITRLAEVCAGMHYSGLNHRDCYICHFLLDRTAFERNGEIRLFVLDLHRAEIRNEIPRRLRVKDLAGIFFSSMDLGLSRRDALHFMAVYRRGGPLDGRLWRDVHETAVRLYRKEWNKEPPPCPETKLS